MRRSTTIAKPGVHAPQYRTAEKQCFCGTGLSFCRRASCGPCWHTRVVFTGMPIGDFSMYMTSINTFLPMFGRLFQLSAISAIRVKVGEFATA